MNDSIILYSSPSCPKCRMLKMELSKKGIEYQEIQDVDLMTSLGIKSLPVLQVREEFLGMQKAILWVKEQ